MLAAEYKVYTLVQIYISVVFVWTTQRFIWNL